MKITWLASYPKSGNTWMRAVLTDLLRVSEESRLSLNRLVGDTLIERQALESLAGLNLSGLKQAELEHLWPSLYQQYLIGRDEPALIKTHDRWRLNDLGKAIFPPELSRGVLHIVRDPRDVCVSWAHFFGTEMATAVERLADPNASIAAPVNQYARSVAQPLGSWSSHAESWITQTDIPVLTLRYEDLLAEPQKHFIQAAEFCGLSVEPACVERAIKRCQFANLQADEDADSVTWKPDSAERLIRRGQAGGWRDELSQELANRVEHEHANVMRQLGYLPERKK